LVAAEAPDAGQQMRERSERGGRLLRPISGPEHEEERRELTGLDDVELHRQLPLPELTAAHEVAQLTALHGGETRNFDVAEPLGVGEPRPGW
jgi:hypothetical protein